jgi:hypothetical protein
MKNFSRGKPISSIGRIESIEEEIATELKRINEKRSKKKKKKDLMMKNYKR